MTALPDNMPEHQKRVLFEKQELDDRRRKLWDFLGGNVFKTLPVDEQDRLTRQSEAMSEYSKILAERIKHFGFGSVSPVPLDAAPGGNPGGGGH